MGDFDPKTATDEEFEAEARRLFDLVQTRLDSMTEAETEACRLYMMPGLLDTWRTFRPNVLLSLSGVEANIATCVTAYRQEHGS